MATSHKVIFEPMGISCLVEEGRTILEASGCGDVAMRADCGGKGRCGKCKVAVHPVGHVSELTSIEEKLIPPAELAQGYRLGCQAQVLGPLSVVIPEGGLESWKALGKTGIRGTYTANPAVTRVVVPAEAWFARGIDEKYPDVAEKTLDLAQAQAGAPVRFPSMEALRDLARPVPPASDLTLVSHAERGVTAVLHGARPRSLGVAFDIGTTTIAAYLCDLATGEVLSAASSANPQRRYGEDVISRIAFANERPDGLAALHALVVDEMNGLIGQCVETTGAERSDVDEVTVVGNPTMEQIFCGLHPNSIGFSPYLPVTRIPPDMTARELGLDLHPAVNVHVFPMISGFVGGDTMGAIIADRPHERDEVTLLVDIGTNGEVVLGNREGLWVTSCATGPALEGAHLSAGMRATVGAISKVDIDPETLAVETRIIGEVVKPRGLCGSGIIDAVAAMRRAGLVRETGRIIEGRSGVFVDDQGVGRSFTLVPAAASATGADIVMTLSDVRQIQLAKGALATGITLLMRRSGIAHIDRMVLTGAFGARFDWKNAVAIGMLPDATVFDHVETVENAAGIGAVMALCDKSVREAARDLLPGIKVLELGGDPDFPTEFPRSMSFPAV